MKNYITYLKSYLHTLLMFLLFFIVFIVLTFLYGLPIDGVVYAAILCTLICAAAHIHGYLQFRHKHQELQSLFSATTNTLYLDTMPDTMPAPQTQLEQDYQEMIEVLHQEMNRRQSEYNYRNGELKDFYTMWIHQAKTPISAMSLMLQSDDFDKKALQQELFKIECYNELVLNYLRIDDISSDLSLSKFQLEKIVRQAVKKYAPIFIGKKISIELGNLDSYVITDDKWLCLCIEQILSNALKYTANHGENHGLVKIYTEMDSILVIEDNGIGIAAEDLPRIFEKGFTGYNGRQDKKATGIGLYLTKKTLDKLGHSITIESHIDQGTTVKIDLKRESLSFE